MTLLKTCLAGLGFAAASSLLAPDAAPAQWYSGSPYGGYYQPYDLGSVGYQNFQYSVVNPNGTTFGYSFGYPSYPGTDYGFGYGHPYTVVPTPQFGTGSYSYVPYTPTYYYRPGYLRFFTN